MVKFYVKLLSDQSMVNVKNALDQLKLKLDEVYPVFEIDLKAEKFMLLKPDGRIITAEISIFTIVDAEQFQGTRVRTTSDFKVLSAEEYRALSAGEKKAYSQAKKEAGL